MKLLVPLILLSISSQAMANIEDNPILGDDDFGAPKISLLGPADGERFPGGYNPARNLSSSNKPTAITYINDGGYIAWMEVEYTSYDGTNNGTHYTQRTRDLGSFMSQTLTLPADAQGVRATVKYNTGWFWEPTKKMYSKYWCTSTNIWRATDGSKDKMEFKSWGTTFNPYKRLEQPQFTVKNGNDPTIQCRP